MPIQRLSDSNIRHYGMEGVDGALPSILRSLKDVSTKARMIAGAGLIAGSILVSSLSPSPAMAHEVTLESDIPVAVQAGPRVASAAAVQLAPAPAPRVEPSSRGAARTTPDISTPQKFIDAVAEPAQESQRQTGAPASVTIAQAILESEWGRSGLSKKAQNYFGIKALGGPGPAGSISMNTWEVFGGKDVVIKDAFKAYNSLYESVIDHGEFLKTNKRYAKAFETTDPGEFAERMHEAGYATDPAYCTKLRSLISKYNLTQYDNVS